MAQAKPFRIDRALVDQENQKSIAHVEADCDALARQLQGRNIDIDEIARQVEQFAVAIPSWGVGTGGTRFGRFPGIGEPRDVFEKLLDCATIHQLCGATPEVSLHIPWDRPDDPRELIEFARELGIGFDAMNSNTFQDQPEQTWSYKFGSLSHTDADIRRRAVEHNIEVVEIGKALGSRALTVWIGDGGNFPGQLHFRRALDRYIASMAQIYEQLPDDWRLLVEYKFFEPAFYSTVMNDWGTALVVTQQLGEKARVLVDLGHHAPHVNVEMIVARLAQLAKLGGFHFNDSKYADDDLDAGCINPFQLFLVFHELIDAAGDPAVKDFDPAYMIDQSHNVTDPIESLLASAEQIVGAYARALLVDRAALGEHQERNDAIMAQRVLTAAYATDVMPLLQMIRHRQGAAIDPISVYRASGYRQHKGRERPASSVAKGGSIVG